MASDTSLPGPGRYLTDDAFQRSLSIEERETGQFRGSGRDALARVAVGRWDRVLYEAFGTSLSHPTRDASGVGDSFRALTAPIVDHATSRLLREVSSGRSMAIGTLLDLEPFLEGFRDQVSALLHRLVERTMVFELNVARVSGTLTGPSDEARFQSFVRRLRHPERAREIWEEYPVLARALVSVASDQCRALAKFVEHLDKDRLEIAEMFFRGRDPGKVAGATLQAGDSHRGGRAVTIITFATGEKLVYKPRSLAVDVHFYELVRWLNKKQPDIQLKTLRVLDRGGHGWVEFVVKKGCASSEEVRRFYRRQGAYLALLYALGGTDIHRENIIACGEHPVVVDLESLFHPRLPRSDVRTPASYRAFVDTVDQSVLATGLLPVPTAGDILDLSGLAGRDCQRTPHKVLQWRDAGTAYWHYVRDHTQLSPAAHAPRLDSEPVEVSEFITEVLSGFRSCYKILTEHRDHLLGPSGLRSRFRNVATRVIVRSTQTYGVLLQESFHPRMLRDAVKRDGLFDELHQPSEQEPHFLRVIDAEQADLRRNDIPLFWTTPVSRDLWTSSGERIRGLLLGSGLDVVERRLGAFGQRDIAKQTWLIQASLQASQRESVSTRSLSDATRSSAKRDARGDTEVSARDLRAQLLREALRLGHRLEALSMAYDDSASWLNVARRDRHRWCIEPCGADLYLGLPGIAFFLAYLAMISGEERFTVLAHSTIRAVLTGALHTQLSGIGLFTGYGGLVYALTHLALLWDDDELLAAAQAYIEELEPLVEADEDFDVVDGAAGCILGLLPFFRATQSEKALDVLVRCGDRLIDRARPQTQGLGWHVRLVPDCALAGMAHGAAGVALALSALWGATGLERFRDAAKRGIEYERSLFSPEDGNWLDLREDNTRMEREPENKLMASWCHGAPGIGMARIATLRNIALPGVKDEVETALQTTSSCGFGSNHCLCHGDFGNLDLFLHARDKLHDDRWAREIVLLSTRLVREVRTRPKCGIPLQVQSPGLMLGLAGIGFGLLRLVDARRVPSVLLAEGPVGTGRLRPPK